MVKEGKRGRMLLKSPTVTANRPFARWSNTHAHRRRGQKKSVADINSETRVRSARERKRKSDKEGERVKRIGKGKEA